MALRKYIHGECIITEMATNITSIPGCVKKDVEERYMIANSTNMSSVHYITVSQGVSIYGDENNNVYVENSVEVVVFCDDKTRHEDITIPSGTWKITIAKEMDYLSDSERYVED